LKNREEWAERGEKIVEDLILDLEFGHHNGDDSEGIASDGLMRRRLPDA